MKPSPTRLKAQEIMRHKDLPSAQDILELWDDNEQSMGEMAAFSVTCDMLGIDEDEAYTILGEEGE